MGEGGTTRLERKTKIVQAQDDGFVWKDLSTNVTQGEVENLLFDKNVGQSIRQRLPRPVKSTGSSLRPDAEEL